MLLNSVQNNLPNQKKVWKIDSAQIATGNLQLIYNKGTHWVLTLTVPTQIDALLDDINNADGWIRVRVTFRWYECVAQGYGQNFPLG